MHPWNAARREKKEALQTLVPKTDKNTTELYEEI